jgi:hypothetical protein
VVVIATDGLPTNELGESTELVKQEFLQALRSLQQLPCWVVIRLCTNDTKVVDYYNQLDSKLEVSLDVLDDIFGEAREIHRINKWLTYGLPLHRCREMGYHHRTFDLLDERLLTKDELLEYLQLLFGAEKFTNAPDIHTDWSGFKGFLNQVLTMESVTWNPICEKPTPWINMKQLDKAYGNKRSSRVSFWKKKIVSTTI